MGYLRSWVHEKKGVMESHSSCTFFLVGLDQLAACNLFAQRATFTHHAHHYPLIQPSISYACMHGLLVVKLTRMAMSIHLCVHTESRHNQKGASSVQRERERVPPSAWPSSTSGAKQKDPADPLELSRSMTQAARLCSAIEHYLLIGELDTPRVAHSCFKWHMAYMLCVCVSNPFTGFSQARFRSVPVLVSINDLDGIATVRYMHLIHILAKIWQGQGRSNMSCQTKMCRSMPAPPPPPVSIACLWLIPRDWRGGWCVDVCVCVGGGWQRGRLAHFLADSVAFVCGRELHRPKDKMDSLHTES